MENVDRRWPTNRNEATSAHTATTAATATTRTAIVTEVRMTFPSCWLPCIMTDMWYRPIC